MLEQIRGKDEAKVKGILNKITVSSVHAHCSSYWYLIFFRFKSVFFYDFWYFPAPCFRHTVSIRFFLLYDTNEHTFLFRKFEFSLHIIRTTWKTYRINVKILQTRIKSLFVEFSVAKLMIFPAISAHIHVREIKVHISSCAFDFEQ